MTAIDLYTTYRAHCDLATRDIHPGIPLPATLTPAKWMPISDVAEFVSLHLTRLTYSPPILQKLAAKNLKALHRTLNAATHTEVTLFQKVSLLQPFTHTHQPPHTP